MPTSLASGTIVVLKGVLESVKLVKLSRSPRKEGAKVPASGEELKLVADSAEVRYTDR